MGQPELDAQGVPRPYTVVEKFCFLVNQQGGDRVRPLIGTDRTVELLVELTPELKSRMEACARVQRVELVRNRATTFYLRLL